METSNWKSLWFLDRHIQQAQYMNHVNNAQIPGQVKDFCRYIASKASWKHTKLEVTSYQPCYASQDTIEIQMGRSRDYVTKAKKEALALGWVQVMHRDGSSDLIWPCMGENDPKVKPKVKRERWGRDDLQPVD